MAGRTQSQAQYQQSSINSAENHKASDETVDTGPSELIEHTARGILKSRGSQESLPKKKSSFQITSVKKLPGDQGFEDADSLDDLDETHTEDVSSDMLDVSKSTDIEPDPPSVDTLHSVPQVATSEESRPDPAPQPQGAIVGGGAQPVGGSAPVVLPVSSSSKDKVQELQSRFKVVKIESKEPFRRGRWTCHDFLDPPAEKTAIEKSDVPSKPDDVGSGNSSAASSVHYVPGVDDPSKNPFGPGAAIGANQEMPHPIVEPKPVRAGGNKPMQNGQVQTPPEGNSSHIQGGSDIPVPAQGNLPPATSTQQPTVNGHHPVPSQSSMNAQQTMPAQGQVSNAAPGQQGAVQPGVTPGQVPSQGTVSQTGNVSMQQNTVPAERNKDYINPAQSQDFRPGVGQEMVAQGGEFNPHGGEYRTSAQPNVDLNQTQQPKPPQPLNEFSQAPHSLSSHAVLHASQQNQPALVGNSNTSPNKEAIQGLDAASQEASGAFPAGAEQTVAQPDVVPREPETAAAESVTAKASTSQPFLSPPLLEMVIQQQPQLRGIPVPDSEGGASTVAIDNKIEQAMDLVKSHLMFAVREEVEVLKEQIKDLLEKNSQLEYENNILRGGASPETLAKLAKIESNKTQPPTTTS